MSTTVRDMARSPFSTAAFAQLVRRLRHTNARYDQIASQFRCRVRPTHHAKRRAYWAGLRIDTTKARACPNKYVSVHPPPVLDLSTATPGCVGPQANAHTAQGDACVRRTALRNLPEVVVRKQHRRDSRHRVTLRLPQLKFSLKVNYPRPAPFQEQVPSAPRLSPKQLPDVETDVEEMMLGSVLYSSFTDGPESLTPMDVRVYSGLCITIPQRSLKRKLQDVEADERAAEQPKRVLRARWNESQR